MDPKLSKSFKKVLGLIKVLRKCNGKTVLGEGALISARAAGILAAAGLTILAGGLFLGMYLLEPAAASFITAGGLAQTLMMILLILSFVLAVKDIVTVLYTSDDLELLVPLPFSASQIVLAKLAVASRFPVILSLILMGPACLGYGIRAGAGAPYIIGALLASLMIPVTGIAAAALLVVVVFRVFGVLRSRDVTVALGGIFTFGLTVAYMIVSNSLQRNGAGEESLSALTNLSAAFPNISFLIRFMTEGSVTALLIGLAVPLVTGLLATLAVKAFYFDTALNMLSTRARRRNVSADMIRGGRKSSALKALTACESRSARRNPSYLIYGFVMSFLWPVLFALPFLFDNGTVPVEAFPVGTAPAVVLLTVFAVMASCFACGFNILPGTAFTREGSTFSAIKALPVDMRDYVRSKRDHCLKVCSLGSVLYVVILGAVLAATGALPPESVIAIPAAAFLCFLLNVILIDLMILRNSKAPRFDWDSETEFSRKLGLVNGLMVFTGVLMFTAAFIAVAMAPVLAAPGMGIIIPAAAAGFTLCVLFIAWRFDRHAVETAAKNLERFE